MALVQYRLAGANVNQISQSIESAVRTGALQPGAPLPTVRALAEELEVAAGTVASAYKALRIQGVLETQGRRGTFVRSRAPVFPRSWMPAHVGGVVDVASGQPDPLLLPDLNRAWSKAPVGPAAAPRGPVEPHVLEVAQRMLADDRVPAGSLTLANGGLDAIHRLLAVHLNPGDTVGVEDPGWPNLLDLMITLGLHPRPITIDHDGPRPESLRSALQAGARAVIVTSRAQNPTGCYLTEARGRELRSVLREFPQTLLLEDDHAAELTDVALITLAEATQRWAHVRSTSKPYGPDLRLAVIAGDEATIARFDGWTLAGSGWVSTLLQRLVLGLWTDRRVQQAVRNAGHTYTARRQRLISQLAANDIRATGATGLNVWIPVQNEVTVVAELLQTGWAVAPGAWFRQRSAPGIRITVSDLSTEQIDGLAEDITRVATAPKTLRGYTA